MNSPMNATGDNTTISLLNVTSFKLRNLRRTGQVYEQGWRAPLVIKSVSQNYPFSGCMWSHGSEPRVGRPAIRVVSMLLVSAMPD